MKVKLTNEDIRNLSFRLGFLTCPATGVTVQEMLEGVVGFVEQLEFDNPPELVAMATRITQLSSKIEDLEFERKDLVSRVAELTCEVDRLEDELVEMQDQRDYYDDGD